MIANDDAGYQALIRNMTGRKHIRLCDLGSSPRYPVKDLLEVHSLLKISSPLVTEAPIWPEITVNPDDIVNTVRRMMLWRDEADQQVSQPVRFLAHLFACAVVPLECVSTMSRYLRPNRVEHPAQGH